MGVLERPTLNVPEADKNDGILQRKIILLLVGLGNCTGIDALVKGWPRSKDTGNGGLAECRYLVVKFSLWATGLLVCGMHISTILGYATFGVRWDSQPS